MDVFEKRFDKFNLIIAIVCLVIYAYVGGSYIDRIISARICLSLMALFGALASTFAIFAFNKPKEELQWI
jgi:hypothetical protein